MSLEVCKDCTARYAVGLESCPQCGSADSVPNWVADAEPLAGPDAVLAHDGDGDPDPADDDGPPASGPADPPAGLPVLPSPAPEDGAVVT